MIIIKSTSRRTFLRGTGAAIALPSSRRHDTSRSSIDPIHRRRSPRLGLSLCLYAGQDHARWTPQGGEI